ncbi:hypothetical protein QBC45DRAFT_337027, partial [Copromyces sp. CBS 386.78]
TKTTTNAQQPTMEQVNNNNNNNNNNKLPAAPAAAVISEQPKSNPMLPTTQRPTAANNQFETLETEHEVDDEQNIMGLRGGWITLGKHFNCCGLNCGFSKTF